jgi:hypothetical protein
MIRALTCTSALSALALVLISAPAVAQQKPKTQKTADAAPDGTAGDCPPGAFCEQTEVAPPDEAGPDEATLGDAAQTDVVKQAKEGESTTVVLPPPRRGDDPSAPRTFTYQPDPDGGPGQIIIYEDGAAPPQYPQTMEAPDAPPPPRKKKRWRKHRRWGMNLRIDGVILPRYSSDVDDSSGMAGLGLSLRYRPTPMFAMDFSSDFIGGTDANGLERQEIPLGVSAMLYANPRNVVQFYLFAGLNWSFARVFSEEPQANLREGTSDSYSYFGGHGGIGLEFRVSKLIGLNIDGMAFVRTRTDDDGTGEYPEFYNPRTQEASNSSAAGLMRAGVTFWW